MLASILSTSPWLLGRKILYSLAVLVVAGLIRIVLRRLEDRARSQLSVRVVWTRKFLGLLVGAVAVIALVAIWFENGGHVATFSGLVGAGVAFASQQALLSVAGFFVIVFGKVFNIGERIEMDGVRGDVIDIGLLKTTVMEMGVPEELIPDPNHWVASRQYTGRVVTITNSRIFEKPVYNLSRNFNFLWEELRIPIKYGAPLRTAEQIILGAVRDATSSWQERARVELERVRQHFLLQQTANVEPRVYAHLTSNWIELAVRFVCPTSGIRELKDQISRAVLAGFQARGIEVASTTIDLVGIPPLEVEPEQPGEPGSPPPP